MNIDEFKKSKWYSQAKKPNAEQEAKSKYEKWKTKGNISRGVLDKVEKLLEFLQSDKISVGAKAVVIAAILYAISPVDLVPDVIPVVGWLDDLAVIGLAFEYVRRSLKKAEENSDS